MRIELRRARSTYVGMRYYFHLRDHGTVYPDDEGTELADDGAARDEALLSARELLRIGPMSVREWLGRSYEIMDENGRCAAVVPFAEAMDIAF